MKMFRVIVFSLLVAGCICAHVVEHHDDETTESLEHEFMELLNQTGSTKKLSMAGLNQVLDNLNEQCLRADTIFSELGINNSGMDEHEFANASWIIVRYLRENGNLPCNNTDAFSDIVRTVRETTFASGSICPTNISNLITAITRVGKYQARESAMCLSVSQFLPGCVELEVLDDVMARIVIAMSRGMCFLPQPSFFTEDVFAYFDATDMLTEENFEVLLRKFNLGGQEEHHEGDGHDHGEDEEHHEGDGHDHDDDEGEHHEGDGHDHDDDEGEHHEDDGHDHDDDGGEHHEGDGHDHRRKRNADDEMNVVTPRCYSVDELLSIVGATEGLTRQGLLDVCPAILQQTVRGACREEDHHDDPPTSTYTEAQKYGYGTVAVLIISLLAFGGLLLFPAIGSSTYKLTMQFFIALGVGTLSGDALLHLIPEVLGLHVHEAGGDGHDHDHEEEEEDQSYIYKLLVVIAGIYFFFLLENVLRLYNQLKGKNINFQHHESNNHCHGDRSASTNHRFAKNSIKAVTGKDEDDSSQSKDMKVSVSDDDLKDVSGNNTICCGVTPVGLMVLIGDMLHNFGDGLALGVAFSVSAVSGIGASIAIFCHELPHEFGDFAIYMQNGMSKGQALLFNFVAACCAFIGLYIGLSVSENPDARQWMLAAVAGMFLYISLVDVLHELVEEISVAHPMLQFFLQNLGMVIGWVILLLLAIFEDKIRTALD